MRCLPRDVLRVLPVFSSDGALKAGSGSSQQAARTKERITPRVDNRYVNKWEQGGTTKLHSVVRIGFVALMLAGAFLAGQHYSRTAAAQSVAKWEYKIVGCGVGCSGQVAEINKLGDEGWQ